MKSKFLIIFIPILFFMGCSSGSSKSNTLEQDSSQIFKAKLSSNFLNLASSNSLKKSYQSIGDISDIVCFGVLDGEVDFSTKKSTTVANDGSFSVDFKNTQIENWVMLMSNPSATALENRIGNFISLSGTNSNLSLIPMGRAIKEINAGNLTVSADETISSNSLTSLADNFEYDSTELLARASLDSSIKGAKNDLINHDSSSGVFYDSMLDFKFSDISYINNTFSDVSKYKNFFSGWSTSIITNKFTGSDFTQLCNGDINLEFQPPSEIISSETGEKYTSTSPITNATMNINSEECSDKNLAFVINIEEYLEQEMIRIKAQTFKNNTPSGYWKLNSNKNELAIFDFNLGSIFDKDGNFQVLIPSVKFHIDSNFMVSKIDIKWYRYLKGSATFQEVTDESTITEFIKEANIYIMDMDGITSNPQIIEDSVNIINGTDLKNTISQFSKKWYVTGNSDNTKITVNFATITIQISSYLTVNYLIKFK